MSGRHWKPQDLETLRELYPHRHTPEVAELLGRSAVAIFEKARMLRVFKNDTYMAFVHQNRPGRPCVERGVFMMAIKSLNLAGGFIRQDVLSCTSYSNDRVKSRLVAACAAGDLYSVGKNRWTRYFLTAEAAQEFRMLAEQQMRVNRATARLARYAKARATYAESRSARPAKAPRVVKVKPIPKPRPVKVVKVKELQVPRHVATVKLSRAKVLSGPIIIPDHIRVVRGPCNLDKRYTAHEVTEPHFSALRPGQYIDPPRAWVGGPALDP